MHKYSNTAGAAMTHGQRPSSRRLTSSDDRSEKKIGSQRLKASWTSSGGAMTLMKKSKKSPRLRNPEARRDSHDKPQRRAA